MKQLHYFAIVLLFTSSLSYAGCNNYGAAGVYCTDSDGSTSSYHNYPGGVSTYQDSRGTTASINRYEGGYIGVAPGQSSEVARRPYEAPGSVVNPVTITGSYGFEYTIRPLKR